MIKTRFAKLGDIPAMLELQQQNLYSELTDLEREAGFVTTPFTLPQIEDIISKEGLFISEIDSRLIAYAFAGTWDYFDQWPIFPFMTSRFPQLTYKNFDISREKSFQYGPVCVEKSYRGKQVFNHVFEEMRLHWLEKYPLSITFINQINSRSCRAHQKIGWDIIDEFDFNGNRYYSLAFDMRHSVI